MEDGFPTTNWSVVVSAGREDARSREALGWLCETYWYPLYAYVRRRRYDAQRAADLTQSFFVELLERRSISRIDPSLGKFRAFLLASMNHLLSNHRDRERTLKRRADNPAFHLDSESADRQFQREPDRRLGPVELFEVKWARTVLHCALRRMDAEHEATSSEALFRRLRGHLTGDEPSYEHLAGDLGMTEGALRAAVLRLRRRFGALLREEVARTVADPAEVDAELRNLLVAAGRGA